MRHERETMGDDLSSRAERGIGWLMSVTLDAHSHVQSDPSLRSG
jgi:hypothetical protein